MAQTKQKQDLLRDVNEALVLSSVRRDERADAAEALNARLRQEIAERERAEALLSFQKEALERLAAGEPAESLLDFIAQALESQSLGEAAVAVHLMENDGFHFGFVAAPSLPRSYSEATRGMDARLQMGPCSAAVMEHQPTLVCDFEEETRWPAFAAEILALGFRSCFTTPIVSTGGRILGTLAVYYREPGDRTPSHDQWIEIGTRAAAVVIERNEAEEKLRASEERFRTLFDLGPVAIYSCDASGVIREYNRRAAELWGREPEPGDTDEKFCGSFKLFRPDGSFMPHAQCPMADVISGKIGAANDAEVLIERPDGSRVTAIVNIRPLTDRRGVITGAINCFYDITERKEAERYQRLLMNELTHRGKNLLTLVQAIAMSSLSGSVSLAEARKVLTQRIEALARSQSALAARDFKGAAVAEIVRAEIEGFSGRVATSGPDVILGPRRARTFTLLVHELATNAVKYGALSATQGTVAIRWSAEDAGAGARFRFQWRERGGPAVAPPSRAGFGRSLLEKAAALDFATQPKIDFAPDGLTYEFDAPLPAETASGAGE